ncbi:hypothetical protein F4777DRAFT_152692 [Nemania sp. FL0916]|nr:hypothetical protein F4777DRAFT_152692 [Nemania sp. FL0916]
MPSHKHLHLRQAHQHWHDFADGVKSVAHDLNPFKEAPHTLELRSPETIYKTVYTTMTPTFDGPIAGWTTVGVPAETTHKTNTADHVTVAASEETPSPKPSHGTKEVPDNSSEGFPESLKPSKSVNLGGDSSLDIANPTSSKHEAPVSTATTSNIGSLSPTDVGASASPTPSTSPSSSDSSPAVKAGIAIGVLGGLLILGLLLFFIFTKRRKQLEQQRAHDNEKVDGAFAGGRTASVHTTRTTATAPRLSLRPVTQFNPTFNERRSSKGAGLMLATAGAPQTQAQPNETGGSMWERPSTARSANPENPFADSARAYSPTGNGPAATHEPVSNPFESPDHVVGMAQTTDLPATPTSPATAGSDAGASAVPVAAVATSTSLTRKASTRQEAPQPLDLTMPAGPPSPTGTDFSMNSVATGQSPGPSKSAAAIAEAGGPPSTAVHRVQLDFKPSMDDELELHAGHLVRILHEYDDGWALCIRLDRSKQGVVPRTCLSTRPVKPRPAGGPPGPRNGGPPVNPSGQRGPRRGPGPMYNPNYPQGPPHGRPESPMRPMNGRPQSPSQMRPYSPAGGRPMSPHTGRPASPAGGRPMSPGPRAQSPGPRQQRPQSPNGMNRRHSPPGPSPMNPNNVPPQMRGPPGPPPQGQVGRKPVPGQAY